MQESIKQMKLINDPPSDIRNNESERIPDVGIGFNGQNSLYELAQKVGHPGSSANFNSTENDGEFQKFLQAENSLGSGQYPYNQFGLKSNSTQQEDLMAFQNKNENMQQQQQQQQMLYNQMQDNYGVKLPQIPLQPQTDMYAPNQLRKEKENINIRNQPEMPQIYQNQVVNLAAHQPPQQYMQQQTQQPV